MTVSIILPTHNRAALVREAIESVLAQTFTDWELLVIDDGSTDETGRVVRALAERDARIRCVHQANAGVSAARNLGVRQAAGECIAFLDDDDAWLPAKLERQLDHLRAHPEYAWCYTAFATTDRSTGRPVIYPDRPGTSFASLYEECYVLTSTVLVRRTLLDQTGGFNPAYPICQDYDLWLRLARAGAFGYLAEPLVRYRQTVSGRLTRDLIAVQRENIRVVRATPIAPEQGVTATTRRLRLAHAEYQLARLYRAEQRFWPAALAFARAAAINPLVGWAVKKDAVSWADRTWPQLVKPYLAIGYCILKGLTHAAR